MANIIITKGSTVTIQSAEYSDDYSNEVKLIPGVTTTQNQASGNKPTKVIDLLKITHTIVIRGYLTSVTDRNTLITIYKGGGVAGGPCSITITDYPNSPLSMFISKCMITYSAKDRDSANQKMFDVQITLIEGEGIS